MGEGTCMGLRNGCGKQRCDMGRVLVVAVCACGGRGGKSVESQAGLQLNQIEFDLPLGYTE